MGKTGIFSRSNMVLIVLYFGWLISYVDRMVINISITQMGEDLALNPTQMGMILSAFFIGYAFMQAPGGWLADRFGSRIVVVTAVLMWSLFTFLTGVVSGFIALILIRIAFGLGEGGYPAAGTKAIAEYFPEHQRTKAQSTLMSSNGVGIGLGPIIAAPLIAWIGWRHTFMWLSILGIFFVIWYLYVTREKEGRTTESASEKLTKKEYNSLFRNPYLWLVVAFFFFISLFNWGLTSWLPSYLLQTKDVNLSSVGFVFSIHTIFGLIAMISSGFIITKVGMKAKYGAIIGAFMMGVTLYLMGTASTVTTVVVFHCIQAIFQSFVMAFIFTAPHRFMDEKVVGTAFGIINFGGQLAGIFAPTIMGYFLTMTGGSYQTAFAFLVGSCFVAMVIAFFFPMRNPRLSEAQYQVAK